MLKHDANHMHVKAKKRVYALEKTVWLQGHFEPLCDTGMMYPNPQAIRWKWRRILLKSFANVHTVDLKAANAIPWPLDDLVHDTHVDDVLHFDYLSLGERDAIDVGTFVDVGYRHVLILMKKRYRVRWRSQRVPC